MSAWVHISLSAHRPGTVAAGAMAAPGRAASPGHGSSSFSGSRDQARLTVHDLEPLTGARAARDIELSARHAARDYIRQAREAGHSWEQIGQALGVAPNTDADQTGLSVAEAAYTYAAGSPYTDTAMRYGRSFLWRCRSCDQAISDRGLIAGPADDELGHTDNCPRLAAAIAEWNAGWEAEP